MQKAILILLAVWGMGFLCRSQGYALAEAPHQQKRDVGAGICPVMREPATTEYSYDYQGKTYYFCCAMCPEAFKKDPEKYLAKIKEVHLESFQYGFSPDPVQVKKDDIVKLILTSRDVPHGVYIKEYAVNVMIKKGETKKVEFVADRAGTFDVICSLYCGPGHSRMRGKLIVEERG